MKGDKQQVDSILDWCKEGPPMAVVEDVAVEWEEYTGTYDGFEITY